MNSYYAQKYIMQSDNKSTKSKDNYKRAMGSIFNRFSKKRDKIF